MKTAITAILFTMIMPSLILSQSYSGGSGTIGDPYQISTKTDLKYLSENSGEWAKHFKQTANISFNNADFQSGGDFYNSGNGFIPIGNNTTSFTGTYDGGKFSISNLYISRSSSDYVGFFGKSFNTVTNLYLLSVNITGANYVGGISGSAWAGISGCYSTGTVSGTSYSGGLIGWMTNGSPITESGSACAVTTSGGFAGGLIGRSDGGGSVSNSFATGNVSATGSYAGGLIGFYENASVYNCYATGTVSSGMGFLGGFTAGENGTIGLVIRCFWDTQTSGVVFSDGGTGRTTAQMQTQSTFTDSSWDFNTFWQISGSNYPTLQRISINTIIVTTNAATNNAVTAATLNGTITTSGDTSAIRFLYGTTSGVYTDSINATPDTVKANTATTVTAALTGLSNATRYYYKVIAQGKSAGHYISGNELSFFVRGNTDTIPGSATMFPGSGSNYVGIPYSSALNPSDNFTIEFWAWCAGGNTYRAPIASENSTGGSHGYYFYADNSNHWSSWLGIGSGWAIIQGDTVKDSVWTHLATTYSSGTMKFYINGVLQDSATSVGFQRNTLLGFNIGDLTEVTGTFPFYGKVDEVRLWGIACTQQEIRENMHRTISGSDTNLIAYFQLNEGSGDTTRDVIDGFIGTRTGSPSWMTSTIPVGGGISTTQLSFTTGTTNLGTVSMTMTNDFDNAVDLTATKIDVAPNSATGITGTALSDQYWVMNSFGTPGTFAANLTFTVPSTFTNNGAASASNYTLYHRSANDDGNWTAVVNGATSITGTTLTFNGVNSFSQFTIGTEEELPVELTSFTVIANNRNTELNWRTATEVNNYGFEIERTVVSHQSSVISWSKLGFVEGSGTTNSPKQYSYIDKNINAGKYLYRLKQIDRDGKFSFSQAVEVAVNGAPKEFALEQNYPNPFNPTTTIEYNLVKVQNLDKVPVTLKIYDVIGREVATLVNEVKEAGSYSTTFDASTLSSGIYFARLQSGNNVQLKKMTLLK
ncbi:MAG: LamG-like jellyroll fold domain-containing protein [Bacteroidota bacterium]